MASKLELIPTTGRRELKSQTSKPTLGNLIIEPGVCLEGNSFQNRNGHLISFRIFGFTSRCLKITEKVSFNIASEASYVYILSGQKLSKTAQNGSF